MHDGNVNNSLDVSVDWSSLYAVLPSDRRTYPVRIQRDYFSRIEEVRRELRSVEMHREDTFVGTVERLDGEMGGDGRRSGDIVLALLLAEGESVRVRTTLAADDYAKADVAHMTEGAYVQIRGRLHPGRQPRTLSDVIRFELIRQ